MSPLDRRWKVAVFAAAVLLHLPYMAPGGALTHDPKPMPLVRDEATVLYDALRIARGQVMYRDFFEFHPPIFYHAMAGVFAATGPSMEAARGCFVLVAAAAATLLAAIVARFAGPWAGFGAAAFHTCGMTPVWPLPYPHWLAEPLLLGGVAWLARERRSSRADFGAGALLAAGACTMHSIGLPVLAAALGACSLDLAGAGRWRAAAARIARVAAGALAVVAPLVVCFAALGAAGEMFHDLFVWTRTNYGLGQEPNVSWTRDLANAIHRHAGGAEPWRTLAAGTLLACAALPLLAVAAAGLGAAAAVRAWRRGDRALAFAVLPVVALAAYAPLLIRIIRSDLTHVVFAGSFAIAGIAAGAGAWGARSVARRAVAALLVVFGSWSLASYAAKTLDTWNASRALGTWREQVMKLPGARLLDSNLPADSTMVSGIMGGFYYLFVRPSAVSYTFLPHQYPDYYSPAQWREIAGEIHARKPLALLLTEMQAQRLLAAWPGLLDPYRKSGGLYLRPLL